MRSVALVKRAYEGAVSYSYLQQCAIGWAWKERADAFDLWQAQARDKVTTKLRDEHVERWLQDQIEIGELQTQIVKRGLEALNKKLIDGADGMRPNELARLIEVLHKNQNLATGKPTEIVDNQIDLSDASDGELADLAAMRDRLTKIAQGAG